MSASPVTPEVNRFAHVSKADMRAISPMPSSPESMRRCKISLAPLPSSDNHLLASAFILFLLFQNAVFKPPPTPPTAKAPDMDVPIISSSNVGKVINPPAMAPLVAVVAESMTTLPTGVAILKAGDRNGTSLKIPWPQNLAKRCMRGLLLAYSASRLILKRKLSLPDLSTWRSTAFRVSAMVCKLF